jgi:Holliday junction resolvase-like predicted endonuclease
MYYGVAGEDGRLSPMPIRRQIWLGEMKLPVGDLGAVSRSGKFSNRNCIISRPMSSAKVKLISCFPPFSRERSFTAWIGLRGTCSRRTAAERPAHRHAREKDAYFPAEAWLCDGGAQFQVSRSRGEINLIGWDADVLCFIAVNARTVREEKTAEAAVDRHKRREVAQQARQYLRRLPPSCQWRFDIVSVYYGKLVSRPQIEVFRKPPCWT